MYRPKVGVQLHQLQRILVTDMHYLPSLTLAMQRIAISQIVHNFNPCSVDTTEIKTREFVTLLVDSPLKVKLRLRL